MKGQLLWIVILLSAHFATSARILSVFAMSARSHHNLFQAVLRTLAERGHKVVNYSPYLMENPVANLTEIHLDKIQTIDKKLTRELLSAIMDTSPVRATSLLWQEGFKIMEEAFQNNELRDLLESKEKFDLIILEAQFAQEGLLGLGHKFGAPVVSLQPFGSFSIVNKVAGNSLALPYIPDFAFASTNHMSFYERFLSSYSILSSLFIYYTQYLPSLEDYTRTLFKDPSMPSITDMLQNISFFFNNAHPNVHYAQPYTPNMASIGGIHLAKERKPLPLDIKKFLDSANKHGVIYFSLGSFLPDHLLSQEYFDNFINVFRKLPQLVLWKTGAQLEGLPDNIMTSKWVPQQDVLAHPNVVLFMTHGGIFGQHEAIYFGVPVVCIPFFGDQPMNAKFYEEKGVGVRLLFNTLSEENIHSAITTVLTTPKYKENMQHLSRIYKDRPMSPANTLNFWVEYVIKHKGALHLRPASAQLSWYQLALLDVLSVIFVILVLALTIVYMIIRTTCKWIRRRKTDSTTVRRKKNN